MFSRILVPLDLSPRSDRIVRTAVELAAVAGGRVTLLHVVQQIEGVARDELAAFYGRLEDAAGRKLAALAGRFARKGAAVRCEVLVGGPAAEIVRYATRRRADLVVIGSHRVQPRRPGHGLGTTSHKVAIVCPCPVLLVR